jgi:hypothetical protein
LKQDGTSGTSTLTVDLNSAPVCTLAGGSGCAGVLPAPFSFPLAAAFDAFGDAAPSFPDCSTTLGAPRGAWADPDGDALSFEFGVVDPLTGAQTARAAGPTPAFTFDRLVPGTHSLYMCAIDALGARSCDSTETRVAPPVAGASDAAVWERTWADMAADLESSLGDAEAVAQIGFQMAGICKFLRDSGLPLPALLDEDIFGPVDATDYEPEVDIDGSEGDSNEDAEDGAGAVVGSGDGASTAAAAVQRKPEGHRSRPRVAKALVAPVPAPTGGLPAALSPSNLVKSMAAAAAGTGSPGALNALVAAAGQLATVAPINPEAGMAVVKLYK